MWEYELSIDFKDGDIYKTKTISVNLREYGDAADGYNNDLVDKVRMEYIEGLIKGKLGENAELNTDINDIKAELDEALDDIEKDLNKDYLTEYSHVR